MKRKKNTDEDDDQSLVDGGILKVLLLHGLGDRNLRLLILPMVQRTNRNPNRNDIHVLSKMVRTITESTRETVCVLGLNRKENTVR